MFGVLPFYMLRSVEFDHQFVGEAGEVNDVRTNGGLTTKFMASELFGAEKSP